MFEILKKAVGQGSYKNLEKYIENLQMLTDVIGDGNNKNGVVMRFKKQYGGGEVRFPNSKEMIVFIKALNVFAQKIGK